VLYRVWSRLTGTARPGASLLVKRPSAHDIDAAMGNWILLVWATGIASSAKIPWMMAAFSVLSVVTAIYKPFAPVIIAELAQILCEVFIWRLATNVGRLVISLVRF